jgi:hypothetical protein
LQWVVWHCGEDGVAEELVAAVLIGLVLGAVELICGLPWSSLLFCNWKRAAEICDCGMELQKFIVVR